GDVRAEILLGEAAEGFAREGEVEGEVHARVTRAVNLRQRGRLAEARTELERALARAEQARDPLLQSEVQIQLGWHCYYERDYGSAWSMLKRAEAAVFPAGSIFLQLEVVDGLAAVAWAAGRPAEALDTYQREIALLAPRDPFRVASVRRNVAVVAHELAASGGMPAAEAIRLAGEALDAARQTGNRRAETGARLVLAELASGPEAMDQAERALALARELDDTGNLCWALSVLARRKFDADPVRNAAAAFALLDEGLAVARGRGDPEAYAAELLARSDLRWRTGPRAQAATEGLAALDAIERIRDLQPDRPARVAVFSRFAGAYRELAARLTAPPPEGAARDDLELAFAVTERMRARSLIDAFDAAGATAALAPSGVVADRRARTLAQISDVQRALLATAIPDSERVALLARLDALEGDERALRHDLARSEPTFGRLRQTEPARLSEVQAALDDDQALLSFVVPGGSRARDDAGRVLVVTRSTVRAVALADTANLDQAVRIYLALLERRDGSDRRGSVHLYDDLLRDALAAVPAGVSRLLLVPDGPLHRLPFDSLREAPGSIPLAVRYETSIIPSATIWLRWKRTVPSARPAPLLSLADPEAVAEEGATAERAAGALAAGARFGRLPFARQEAARLHRLLGGESLVGPVATEAALREADLRRYSIVHFAAHAVLDDEHPERSAVLLAAGSPPQDGLLQVREIVELPLQGQVVVLSACRGATGPIVGGDGPAGLANAFFQAGARTVVAGLWSLRDDEAAVLTESFGRHLASGASVGAALAAARRGVLAGGAPPAAWAGLVALGDPDLVPLPGGVAPARPEFPAGPVLLAALLLAVLVLAWRLARRI
ncbi:MAG: CHAT domain-containing protein, partial [Acidobacteria bacterium]|nr:CHAT domain-containing protein [Acidobacteriota bacterium]